MAWLLSRAKAALGDLDEAQKLAETAVAADESNAAFHVQLAAVEGRIAERSSLLKQLSAVRRARKELDTAVALDPTSAEAQWGLMMYYFAAPPLLGGDKTKSQQIGEQLAAVQPEPGLYYQGRLASELNDLGKAEQFYKQALLENPLSFDNISALANFYIERKPNQAQAEKWACLAVHAEPTRADAWALLARVNTMCGCWTEAAAIAQRAEAIDPEDLAPWLAIAQSAIARGEQLDSAAAWLRRYLSKPSNSDPDSTTEPARKALKRLTAEGR